MSESPDPKQPWYHTMYGRMLIWCLIVLAFGYIAPTDFEKLMSAVGGGILVLFLLRN